MKKLQEDMKLIRRGLCEIHRISPKLLSFVLFQAVLVSLFPFVNIYMSAKIVDGIEDGVGRRTLLFYVVITVVVNLLVHLLSSLLGHVVSNLRYRFWSQCEMQVSLKMMQIDYVDVESPTTHQLRQRIQDFRDIDGSGLENLLEQFKQVISMVFTIVFSVSMVASMLTTPFSGKAKGFMVLVVSPFSSILLILVILLNAYVNMYFGSRMTKNTHIIMGEATSSNRIYSYYLNNCIASYHMGKDIRLYNEKGLLDEESMEQIGVARKMCESLFWNEAKYSGIISVFTVITSTLVYLFVGLRALVGMIGIGTVVKYIGSISKFTEGFSGFVTAFAKIRANNDAMRTYFEFMDIPSHMYKRTQKVTFGTHNSSFNNQSVSFESGNPSREGTYGDGKFANIREVEFRDVSFRYPDTDTWALRHISLKFHVGERLAIVGMNGSGKTTFIKLLCRLYDPTEGSILIDGTDIREYDINEYRDIFSVVFQDFKLFAFTLAENVVCGTKVIPQKVEECLRKAGLEDRCSRMSDGMNTYLYRDFEKEGVEISGGEAQKIALARALYKDAPFVILDEPTAALDPIAEFEIYTRFNEIIGGKTAIYISHRLSSCKFCNDIAVFHMGKLVQRGTHAELILQKNGKYYELWNAQAQHYNCEM